MSHDKMFSNLVGSLILHFKNDFEHLYDWLKLQTHDLDNFVLRAFGPSQAPESSSSAPAANTASTAEAPVAETPTVAADAAPTTSAAPLSAPENPTTTPVDSSAPQG